MSNSVNKKVLEEVATDKIPDWLNEQFFDDILEKVYNKSRDELNNKIVSIKPAVGAGENYMSQIYRVAVETSAKNDDTPPTKHSFIIKFLIDLGEFAKNMPIPAFPKEIKMYSEIIPKFENEFKLIGEEVQFGPKCHRATHDPISMLVFDDLNVSGYEVQNRHKGLDMAHSEVFLTKLAKFHAASAVYHEKNGDYGDQFKTMYNKDMEEMMTQFAESMFPGLIAAIEGSETLVKYLDVVKSWTNQNLDEIIRITSPNPNGFNVLLHADAWLNNFLFSYDENKNPNDILFIDFQISYWASPLIDIIYFFVSSTQNEIRANGFDELLQFYHSQLVDNLTKLGYTKKIPTLKDLQLDFLDKGAYAGLLAQGLLPLILLDPRDDANLSNLLDNTEDSANFKGAMYNTPRFLKALEYLFPFLEKRGVLT